MEPKWYQENALKKLKSIRKAGENRALLVMASSLGKTIIAALDVKSFLADSHQQDVSNSCSNDSHNQRKAPRQETDASGCIQASPDCHGNQEALHRADNHAAQYQGPLHHQADNGHSPRVLCLCHSNTVLNQDLLKFRQIIGNQYSYGLFNGYEKNPTADMVFASFKSVRLHSDLFSEDDFDYIIVDEAHHTPAKTYRQVMELFKPKFLLGITATPDRLDGQRLEDIFGPVVYDLDIVEAMRHNLLVDINYHVLLDELADLRTIAVEGEKISVSELNRRIFIPKRDAEIARLIQEKVEKVHGKSIIIFCCSIEHAEKISNLLSDSRLIHSGMKESIWQHNLKEFKDGKAKYIVSIDQLNEGIDIPRADVIVFLRSTVSRIVYYQQLGRGLRSYEGKTSITILDFVASYERLQIIADFQESIQPIDRSESRHSLNVSIESTHFTEQAIDIFSVLTILKKWTKQSYAAEELISQIRALAKELGRIPKFKEFKADSRTASVDAVIRLFGTWNNFLISAGLSLNVRRDHDKKMLISEVQMLAEEIGRVPTITIFNRDKRTSSAGTAIKIFGSWNDFLRAAGLKPNNRRDYTREELIAGVQMLTKELGKVPTNREFNNDPRMANTTTVRRLFGTWNGLLIAAGLEPNLFKPTKSPSK